MKQLKEKLRSPAKIVTVSHTNPDGDAIGSSLAIKYLLEKIGHSVTSMVPNAYPNFLKYLDDGGQDVFIYDNNETKGKAILEQAEIIFVLDFNTPDRAGALGEEILNTNATIVMIDHHLEPGDFAEFVLHEVSASSTCELVYKFIDDLNLEQYVTKKVADAIYMGILTDTGGFSYNVNANVHRVTANLIDKGADINNAHQEILHSHSLTRMRFWGFCLGKKMKVYKKLPAAIIPLAKEEIYKYNVQKGDSEGLVNQPLSIKGVKLSILLKEENDKVKLSLRSNGDFSVNEMARTHFNGGGHKNAAGGILRTNITEAVDKVHQVILLYSDELLKEN